MWEVTTIIIKVNIRIFNIKNSLNEKENIAVAINQTPLKIMYEYKIIKANIYNYVIHQSKKAYLKNNKREAKNRVIAQNIFSNLKISK